MTIKYVRHLDPWKLPEGAVNAGRVLRQPDSFNIRVQVQFGASPGAALAVCDRDELEEITEEEYKAAISGANERSE